MLVEVKPWGYHRRGIYYLPTCENGNGNGNAMVADVDVGLGGNGNVVVADVGPGGYMRERVVS